MQAEIDKNPNKKIYHKTLAAGRWGEFSLMEQMANIGSEISRAGIWQRKNNRESMEMAVFRGLELIDLTIANLVKIKRFSSIKELTRTREVVCDFFLGDNEYESDFKSLMNYFDEFAIAVAIKKRK